MSDEIVALFSDGGLITSNPSSVGGSWAWCGVTKEGEHVREVSAYLLPRTNVWCPGSPRISSETVTNNDVEFYAALHALESMKSGWTGILATDSEVTIERLKKCRLRQMPRTLRGDWYSRANCALRRLGIVKFVHLAGHPNKKQLEAGYKLTESGGRVRVSRHQVWCDQECTRRNRAFEDHMLGFVETGLLTRKLFDEWKASLASAA